MANDECENTVLIITYDEWGGFFDHVPPPNAPIPVADQSAGNEDGLFGFRVPCVIVSPFARRAHVASTPFDHTSILRFIEWRWDLEPLTVRDATATNLAVELDFKGRVPPAPLFTVAAGPFAPACSPAPTIAAGPETQRWLDVCDLARTFGWPVL